MWLLVREYTNGGRDGHILIQNSEFAEAKAKLLG